MGPSLGFVSNVFTRPRMGPSLGFVSNVFFFLGSTSVTYYGLFYCIIWFVLRHCWSLIALLDLYCASVSQYYLSFKLSGKVVFFPLFAICPFYLFAPAAIVHSFSNYIVALSDDQ